MNEVKSPKKPLIYYYMIVVLLVLLFNLLAMPWLAEHQIKEVDYNTFVEMLEQDKVGKVEIQEQDNRILFTDKDETVIYKTAMVSDGDLSARLLEAGVSFKGEEIEQTSLLVDILGWVLPILIFIALGQYMSKKMADKLGGGNSMMFGLGGNSNVKVYVQSTEGIHFSDVAGEDEAKENLQEVVNYLHDPSKYQEIGASMPKGILLVGPPGTGKTMLAKAVAGESNVPFFSISGSEFVEMFVGMGASKVRDLFKQAKEKAPCIVFIDEIDAIGQKRSGGQYGGNDEREQTLNQLLTEMDGFESNNGVIILAATNRPDILDPALLRPGRFDRQVTVNYPDTKGRVAILKVHAKGKPIAPDVDFESIAHATVGFTGADLENLLNEAALLAARTGKKAITMAEIDEAALKVEVGSEKKSHKMNEKAKRLTAYHEAGHAVVMRALPQHDPVHQITIVPRGQAGGMTISLPQEDRSFRSRNELFEDIVALLGGRVAEELIFDDITTGASQDIKQATATARSMITKYGMSENLGLVAYDSDSDEVFIGRDWGHTKSYSENVAAAIDEEVRQMIEKCHDQAKRIILEHSYVLHECAKQLMEKEKLSRAEFEAIFEQEAQMTGTAPEVSGEI